MNGEGLGRLFPQTRKGSSIQKRPGRVGGYRKSAAKRAERGPSSQNVGFQDVETALAIQKINQAAIVDSHIVGRDPRVT